MTIKLYKTKSENEVVYKELTDEISISCDLMNTNLLKPIIKLDKGYLNYNYAYIEDFGNRYYFVERPITVTGEHIILQLDVDELMTYKDAGLLDIPVYVSRNEKIGVNDIPDSKLPLAPNKWIKSEEFGTELIQDTSNTYLLTIVD